MNNIVQEIIQHMKGVQFEEEESTVIEITEEEVQQGILDCSNSYLIWQIHFS